MAFIDVSSVSKTFTTDRAVRCVLDKATLSVDQGEFVSIVGFMGCGKSTLLSIMAGLALPDEGEVRLGGALVRGVGPKTSIVFQNYSLLPWLTAFENVHLAVASALPLWPADRQANQAHAYLRKVGLASAAHRRPSQLSGGMRQRVAIARALATEPDVLFLDDPFGALDAMTRANLQQELAQLCSAEERPVTTIMITNSVEEALLLSDRIVPMTHGPRATLGRPVAVAIPKPRTLAQLAHDEDAMRSRGHVVESLTASVGRPRRPQFTPQPVDALGLTAVPHRSEA
jgi:ABC-type nitrate/sulfonate/bicarbonate transport system ATPase subunit